MLQTHELGGKIRKGREGQVTDSRVWQMASLSVLHGPDAILSAFKAIITERSGRVG